MNTLKRFISYILLLGQITYVLPAKAMMVPYVGAPALQENTAENPAYSLSVAKRGFVSFIKKIRGVIADYKKAERDTDGYFDKQGVPDQITEYMQEPSIKMACIYMSQEERAHFDAAAQNFGNAFTIEDTQERESAISAAYKSLTACVTNYVAQTDKRTIAPRSEPKIHRDVIDEYLKNHGLDALRKKMAKKTKNIRTNIHAQPAAEVAQDIPVDENPAMEQPVPDQADHPAHEEDEDINDEDLNTIEERLRGMLNEDEPEGILQWCMQNLAGIFRWVRNHPVEGFTVLAGIYLVIARVKNWFPFNNENNAPAQPDADDMPQGDPVQADNGVQENNDDVVVPAVAQEPVIDAVAPVIQEHNVPAADNAPDVQPEVPQPEAQPQPAVAQVDAPVVVDLPNADAQPENKPQADAQMPTRAQRFKQWFRNKFRRNNNDQGNPDNQSNV